MIHFSRRGLLCFALSLLVITPTFSAAFEPDENYSLEVSNSATDLPVAIVRWNFPKGLAEATNAVLLTQAGDKTPIPCQIDKSTNPPALVWIVKNFKAKQTKKFQARFLNPFDKVPEFKQRVKVESGTNGIEVTIDGKPFTNYVTGQATKPFLYPIMGPDQQAMTRHYPMKEGVQGEKNDHPHHRSLWFTHGTIYKGEGDSRKKYNFWHEVKNPDETRHRELVETYSGPVFGGFTSKVEWYAHKANRGEKIAEDVRTFRFYAVPDARLMDVTVTFKASEGPLEFGDDKEGTFGIRVPGTMKVDQKGGKKGGHIVNANGDQDKKAWGKRSPWVDYFGPVDGKTMGIAIFDNPSNLRFPTYWHVRTYGLFAANPFGISFFDKSQKKSGAHKLEKDETLSFNYRVYIHRGDAKQANVAEWFAGYKNPPKVTVAKN